jgi:hypothetical protein
MARTPLDPRSDARYISVKRLLELIEAERPHIPHHVFYRVAVDDVLQRGELAEIQELLKGAREVKAQYGDLDGVIKKLEVAAKKVQG